MSHQPRRVAERSRALPTRLTPFIGREQETADLARLLTETRIVTLVGAPGVGKTRLALRVGEELRDGFADGIWFVELASLSDPDLVPGATAATLGIPERPDNPLLAALIEYLEPRELLLILDNCEHLVQSCASFAEELLRSCPGLRIMSTSREALRIEGETSWRVNSLSIPEPRVASAGTRETAAEVIEFEAIRLFAQRAGAALPSFAITDENAHAVASICRRLDGIPLAIELAAARVGALSVEQIASRLDDHIELLSGGRRTALPRQQTMRAAIDWSYDLLPAEERALLRELSVFAGGWPLEAAEAVCSGDPGSTRDVQQERLTSRVAPDIFGLLLSLIDKSLVQMDSSGPKPRYRLLEMIRQYALERLSATDDEAIVRRRHAAWYADLAEQGQAGLHGADGVAWATRLAAEDDNFRAALEWSMGDAGPGDAWIGLRIAGSNFQFWFFRNQLTEAARWIERTLAAEQERPSSYGARLTLPPARIGAYGRHPRVSALNALSELCSQMGDFKRSSELATEALALARGTGDEPGVGHALLSLASAARFTGQYEEAIGLMETGLSQFQELGDPFGRWRGPSNIGQTLLESGETSMAEPHLEAALVAARAINFSFGTAQALRSLAIVHHRRGDLERATTLLQEGLAEYARLESTRGLGWSLLSLGHVLIDRGEPGRAARHFAEGLELARDAGDRRGVTRCCEGLAAAVALGAGRDVCSGWMVEAVRLLGSTAGYRGVTSVSPTAIERSFLDRATMTLRESLDPDTFTSAYAEGRLLSPRRVIELALSLAHQLESSAFQVGQHTRRRPTEVPLLTLRESEVATHVARGLTNRQIAAELVISERTVDGHVARILAKLEFATRAQIAAWATRQGLTGS